MVQSAERVYAELECQPVVDRKLFEAREIYICISRASQAVALHIAKGVLRGIAEAGYVNIFSEGMRTVVPIAGLLGTHPNSATRIGVVTGAHAEGGTTKDGEESTEPPAAELVLPPLSVTQEWLVLAKWQLIDTRQLEDVWSNEALSTVIDLWVVAHLLGEERVVGVLIIHTLFVDIVCIQLKAVAEALL